MGTNYYLHENVCGCCGRAAEVLHIGKSSGGWCFALHVIPEKKLHDLADWEELFRVPNRIEDEYGRILAPAEMVGTVRVRSWSGRTPDPDWYEENHAESGPNGLARYKIGKYCAGHGAGTWDLVLGEFS